jgi:hypothetical protein
MIGEGVTRTGIGARLTAGLLAAGMALGLAGDARPAETSAIAAVAPASEYFNPDFAATGACEEPTPNDPELLAKARRCEAAMSSGSVALVNFGLPAEVATGAAQLMVETLPKFNENLGMSVTVVTASPAATKRFDGHLAAKGGCADPKNPLEFAAGAAESTMPELAGYDFIIGFTGAKACKPDLNGLSNGYGGRRADVYLGANGEGKAPAEQLETQKRAGGMLSAHELMHLLGLGHAGTISGGEEAAGLENADAYLGHDFDLGAYLKTAYYEPYGDISNLVSMPIPGYVQPNIVDNAFLNWPKRAQGKAPDVVGQVGSAASLTFTVEDVKAGKFAMATLKEPLRLPGKPNKDGSKPMAADEKFTKIVFVPRMNEGMNFGVGVMLVSEDKAIGNLGGITPEIIGEDASSVITIGNQRFEVSAVGLEIKVRELV